ncbi:hypothetical protein F4861DRAFT_444056 [Xylaria intraflava]|nr:hypothetical protein F4861DRAFT_444056 [Xylaria intraflava]
MVKRASLWRPCASVPKVRARERALTICAVRILYLRNASARFDLPDFVVSRQSVFFDVCPCITNPPELCPCSYVRTQSNHSNAYHQESVRLITEYPASRRNNQCPYEVENSQTEYGIRSIQHAYRALPTRLPTYFIPPTAQALPAKPTNCEK